MDLSPATSGRGTGSKDIAERFFQLRRVTRKNLVNTALVALCCLTLAILLRSAFFFLAPQLKFATYFPATLATAVIAGIPAAICVAVLSFVAEWLIFFTPSAETYPVEIEALFFLIVWAVNIGLVILIASWGERLLDRLNARERELRLLMEELQHRGRNTYAVIESVIKRTLRDDPERAEALAGRIRSIKHANDLMVQSHADGVTLSRILKFELDAHGTERYELAGPSIHLSADAARHLVLIFHEMTTNAAKYGALSTAEGKLSIRWMRQQGGFVIRWNESDGPPVQQPERTGFGNTLIAQCATALDASYSQTFATYGFQAEIAVPESALASSGIDADHNIVA